MKVFRGNPLHRSGYFILIIVSAFFTFSKQNESTDKIDNLLKSMTLVQKIDFIGGYNDFNIRAYDSLGIPEIHMTDGPLGARNFGKTIAIPAGINLAASWDRQLAARIGKAIAYEARANDAHIVLGPAMNIYRMPLCGRNFEYLGEDPYLAGQMAKEFIIAMQDEGVMACAKHYTANNMEYNRHQVSSDMDERTLHEIYLPAFRASVKEGHVATIMDSYNLINGVHATENNYLNNRILKNKWQFDGFVMSDWGASYSGLKCALGGLDLEMPSGKMMCRDSLLPAIKEGKLSESLIDDKIRRILSAYQRFNLFENPDLTKGFVFDTVFVRQTSLNAARGGMVLLKNEYNILPLDKKKIKTVAVIGPNVNRAITGGGGSSYVDPLQPLSIVNALKQTVGDSIKVVSEEGIFTDTSLPEDFFKDFDFYVYKDGKKVQGVNARYFKGKKLEGKPIYTAFYKKLNLNNDQFWNVPEVPETNFSARFTCFYTPKESGFYSIGVSGDDGYRIKLDGKLLNEMWHDQAPTPSKSTVSLSAGQEYQIEVEYYQSRGDAQIMLGAKKSTMEKQSEDYHKLAIEAANKADVVIMSVGFDKSTESEGFDRTFELPYDQGKLINSMAAVNSNIIVVLNAGGNVEMNSWLGNVKALLMAWYPGETGNQAAAEILFGITNPSGKLPASFEYKLEDNPCYNSYFDTDGDLKIFYSEGIFIGYRYWDKVPAKPRFPFGYGLSYTTFTISGIKTDKKIYGKDEPVKVNVEIENTGKYDGAEVVQLYVSDKASSLPRPLKELKDFNKVQLGKGEKKQIAFELNAEAFSYYDPEKHDWIVEPGEFEISIGNSSDNISQRALVSIK